MRIPRIAILAVALLCGCSAPGRRVVGPLPGSETVANALADVIEKEIEAKGIPGLSIALVSGQEILWASGFGTADVESKRPADSETIYRAGSVSKLLTDIAIMQLVEEKRVDLDAPLTDYLPDFRPENSFGKAITLRQLMSHRSGLVREPPVGNYFDSSAPSLAATVESLSDTALVYPPTTRTKYSNAGVAVVGRVLEVVRGTDFNEAITAGILSKAGMRDSSFLHSDVKSKLSGATMWTHHGSTFEAPTFELGTSSAGNLYSSVTDLARLMTALLNDGTGATMPRLLGHEALGEMWTPQFVDAGREQGFGLGFYVSRFRGQRQLSHNGAVYGFATSFQFLPDSGFGVVCCSSLDVSNATVSRIANHALSALVARESGEELPTFAHTRPIEAAAASTAVGLYTNDQSTARLDYRWNRLFLEEGDVVREIRSTTDGWIVDDRHRYGAEVRVTGDKLTIARRSYSRVDDSKPAPCPKRWQGLLGEFGWNDGEDPPGDHNVLYILEKDGRLHALIEWIFEYPLTEESTDVFAFPEDRGLYHGEKLVFHRDASGRATRVVAASVPFVRREVGTKDGETFTIDALLPSDELRRLALSASPPPPKDGLRPSKLVDVSTLSDTIRLDIRYATTNNFLSTVFYQQQKAYLQRPAAEAVAAIHRRLAARGYGLLIHDAYRPWFVTKMFYDATPDELRHFVANPARGSRHNRGCAVDLTLYHLSTGQPVDMGAGYDEFSERSYPDYRGGTSLQRWHRRLLRDAMTDFTVYEYEWWHFDHKDWREYGLGNATFEDLEATNNR